MEVKSPPLSDVRISCQYRDPHLQEICCRYDNQMLKPKREQKLNCFDSRVLRSLYIKRGVVEK